MTEQLLRYHQTKVKFVRVRTPLRTERIHVGGLLSGLGLALCTPVSADARPVGAAYVPQTQAGAAIAARQEDIGPAEALEEIKQSSGLTWSQLAALLDVSRKTLHDWSSGSKLRGSSQAKLASLLERVRTMADLPRFKIRTALLGPADQPKLRDDRGPLIISDNTPPRHRPKKLAGSMTMG